MAPHLEVLDPLFNTLVADDAVLEHVATGFGATEGPVWLGDHLLFSDIPRSRTIRWRELPEGPEVTTYRTPTGNANGLTLDGEGRLLRCEHSGRRVTRIEHDGTETTLVDRYEGKRLNSPNDIVVHSSGAIYFTDPPYGLANFTEGKELSFHGVFRLDPNGTLTLLAQDLDRPNGLCFSLDETILYVADTSRQHIRAFDVLPDGSVTNSRIWADLTSTDVGRPDGMKIDQQGNLYCTGGGGVRVLTPAGNIVGRILVSEQNRNIGFGGPDWRTLYMTAGAGLYRIRLNIPGVPVGKQA